MGNLSQKGKKPAVFLDRDGVLCELLGKNAGIKTVLLESGYGFVRLEQKVKPDYILNDLSDIVILLKKGML